MGASSERACGWSCLLAISNGVLTPMGASRCRRSFATASMTPPATSPVTSAGCLLITPRTDFDEQGRVIIDQVNRGELPITAKQAMGSITTLISVDRQGRFTIDEPNRKHAGVRAGGSIRMVGALNTIEIWRESRYLVVEDEKPADSEAPPVGR